jgi:hypothetical protein
MTPVISLNLAAVCAVSLCCATASPSAAQSSCPDGSIAILPGQTVQDFVDKASEGAAFCVKSGIHRLQQVIPKNGQAFFGEDGAVLSGARELDNFERDGPLWVAAGQSQAHVRQGHCALDRPTCNVPDRFYIDDLLLVPVLSKKEVAPGTFYLERATGRLFFADDPQGRRAEATVTQFAFVGRAVNVSIKNIVVEKYSNPAQTGAINGSRGINWTVEGVEARWNSGAGIAVSLGGRVRDSNIHHNGQLGVTARGKNIVIAGNRIWANNTFGFDFTWEAGGTKVTRSEGVEFRRNHVEHNGGPGLWCDIECRNVLYEENVVEYNADAGIFHEISYAAVVRKNVVRFNGQAHRPWYWGADILIAASEDLQIYDNTVTVRPGGNGILLIDQNREASNGSVYKTQNNTIRYNTVVFQGAGATGGAADTEIGEENYGIITQGNNVFDHNNYLILDPRQPVKFAWGTPTKKYDCYGFRQFGQELNGQCDAVGKN